MNLKNQTGQAFVTSSGPFGDCSCKSIFVEAVSYVWRSQACSACTVYNAFRPVWHTVVAWHFGSDLAHLEVLHVSHAVDHFLRLLAEWVERMILLQSAFTASRHLDLDASRIDDSTWGLLPCRCDLALGRLYGNHCILKSISPRQISLYFPSLERSADVLASKLVVSWRPQCTSGLGTILCDKIGDWFVFTVQFFSWHPHHHPFDAHCRKSVVQDDHVGSRLMELQSFTVSKWHQFTDWCVFLQSGLKLLEGIWWYQHGMDPHNAEISF